MPISESYVHDQLQLNASEDESALTIRFSGKSILREPAEFVMPILVRALEDATNSQKRLVLDFCELAYMNSSTLTPVIKVLERARLGEGYITALYRKSLKWQAVSFSALTIFQTSDGRIQIRGAE
jgi:hypothetical protein